MESRAQKDICPQIILARQYGIAWSFAAVSGDNNDGDSDKERWNKDFIASRTTKLLL